MISIRNLLFFGKHFSLLMMLVFRGKNPVATVSKPSQVQHPKTHENARLRVALGVVTRLEALKTCGRSKWLTPT